jgi:hypothetical protein
LKVKVEILYFDSCPSYRTAEKTLKEVLADEGIKAEVELVAVNTDEEAHRLRFPGSPTFRVDERDLFLASEREDWRLGCRIYATPEGLKGSPTAEMLKEALETGSETPYPPRAGGKSPCALGASSV